MPSRRVRLTIALARRLGPLSAARPGTGPVQLRVVSASTACTGSPSFLTLDKKNSTLFCLDESLQAGGGSLTALKTSRDGSATLLSRKDSPAEPVHGALLASATRLAMAHYAGAAVSLWDVSDPLNLHLLQNQSFKLDKPGHDKERQTVARPHQTLVDPTGRYVVVPDRTWELTWSAFSSLAVEMKRSSSTSRTWRSNRVVSRCMRP